MSPQYHSWSSSRLLNSRLLPCPTPGVGGAIEFTESERKHEEVLLRFGGRGGMAILKTKGCRFKTLASIVNARWMQTKKHKITWTHSTTFFKSNYVISRFPKTSLAKLQKSYYWDKYEVMWGMGLLTLTSTKTPWKPGIHDEDHVVLTPKLPQRNDQKENHYLKEKSKQQSH